MSPSSRSLKSNLVVQTAFVGDLLLCLPLLKRLKTQFSNPVTVLCRKGLGDFLRRCEVVDEVIEVDKTNETNWRQTLQQMRARDWNWILCPHESFRSAWLVKGLNAEEKVGFSSWWNFFAFGKRCVRPMHLPDALRQLSLLREFDKDLEDLFKKSSQEDFLKVKSQAKIPTWASMEVSLLAQKRSEWKSSPILKSSSAKVAQLMEQWNLSSSAKIAFLAPGSVWKTKMWTHEGFVAVAQKLRASGWTVVLSGAPNEKEICERIQREVPGAYNMAGETSLFESAEVMCTGDLLICNDSGAMHIAAAVGLPSVSVFGPTTLDLGYRPWQDRVRVVEVELSCRPCGKHGSRECPIGTHDCMKKVSAEKVLEAAKELT